LDGPWRFSWTKSPGLWTAAGDSRIERPSRLESDERREDPNGRGCPRCQQDDEDGLDSESLPRVSRSYGNGDEIRQGENRGNCELYRRVASWDWLPAFAATAAQDQPPQYWDIVASLDR
jgi:hypothetical protein